VNSIERGNLSHGETYLNCLNISIVQRVEVMQSIKEIMIKWIVSWQTSCLFDKRVGISALSGHSITRLRGEVKKKSECYSCSNLPTKGGGRSSRRRGEQLLQSNAFVFYTAAGWVRRSRRRFSGRDGAD